jgi:uncharacterized BrkB/YihY/UPF0761 family membrane protein
VNFFVYIITFVLVYFCYSLAVFGPILLLFILIEPFALEILFLLDTVICVVGIPVMALLFWFTHQTTKKIAYERLSFIEASTSTFQRFKSCLRPPGR